MKNEVQLIGHYGSDEIIALSAWTSTSRELNDAKRARIPALIQQLWHADPVPHGTPFEKAHVHFLITCDIASHIHLLKHRMSSINAESARYKEIKEDKYYIPEDWEGSKYAQRLKDFSDESNRLYHQTLEELTPIVGRKRAKESARYYKMYNSQITCDVLFNMRSFHNFLTQRMDGHAQIEIQRIAEKMLNLVRDIPGQPFQHTLSVWGWN
jgi:flavin-dependent thymidylate synthase